MLAAATVFAAAYATAQSRAADDSPLDPEAERRIVERIEAVFGLNKTGAPIAAVATAEGPRHRGGCATLALMDFTENYSRLSPAVQRRFADLLLRPDESAGGDIVKWTGTYTASKVESTHFVVHYISAPTSHASCATAAFAQQVSTELEYAYSVIHGTLGWPLPPSDGDYPGDDNNGGDGRFDAYLANVGSQDIYGYVTNSGELRDYTVPGYGTRTYMVLDNDFAEFGPKTPLDYLRVTIAHEYGHACQFGLNANDTERWFYESTSVYIEDQVYDSINDYISFLDDFFDYPALSLRTLNTKFEYGAAVWPFYLHERFGSSIVRDIWVETNKSGTSHPTLVAGTLVALAGRGANLPDEFARFAAWNYLTGARSAPGFYPEGATWPQVNAANVASHSGFPVDDESTGATAPQQLAASYVRFDDLGASPSRLRFYFEGSSATPWRLAMVARRGTETVVEPLALATDTFGWVNVEEAQTYDWIVIAPAAVLYTGSVGPTHPFSYQAYLESTLSASEAYEQLP